MQYESLTNEKLLEIYSKEPSIELRNAIYERYQYVAQSIAKKYVGRGIDYEDVLQVARMSLLKCIERFDLERGVRLQSFATPTIVGEIKNYFRSFGNSIKISRRSLADITKIKLTINQLSVDLGRLPTVEEVSADVGMESEHVIEMMEVMENSNSTSLDIVYTGENTYTLADLVGNVDEGYELIEKRDAITRALLTLEEKEKFIITQRFFLKKSQREVADSLEVSQMYISRAERRIFEKLKHKL